MTTSRIKKRIIIAVAICLLAVTMALTLSGCAYKHKAVKDGQPTANTESNNGMVVKQGDFIYFVNGIVKDTDIKEKKDNKYGKIIEGGIYRAKLDGSDVKCIVPQVAYSANAKGGLSIFGEYLYYTSPKVTTSKKGELVTTFLEYYRVKIDGTERDLIATIDGMSTEYKFTDTGLFYKTNNELHYVNNDSKNDKIIDEDIVEIFMPQTLTYSPTAGSPSDVVLYTKSAPEDDENAEKYNRMFVVDKNGESKEIAPDLKDAKRSIKYAQLEGDRLVVYYEKSEYIHGNATSINRGLNACKLGADYMFSKDNERRMTAENGGTYVYAPNSYDKGVFLSSGNELKIQYKNGTLLDKPYVWNFTFSVPTINTFDGNTIYFVKDSDLYSIEMLPNGVDVNAGKNTMQSLGFASEAKLIMEGNISTNGSTPEIINGKFYYYDSSMYDYLYIKNLDGLGKRKFTGVHSEDDKKVYEKFVKELSKDGKETDKEKYEKDYDYIYN